MDADWLNDLSIKTGFIRNNLEKMARLIEMLDVLFASPWKDKLVLKGGTAINLFYAQLARLSVDIDLDYTGQGREETAKDKEAIREFLSGTLLPMGYRFSDASKTYFALDSLVLSYINTSGSQDNIKVEINYMDRCHVLPLSSGRVDVLGIQGDALIHSLALEELYGSKIAALLSRGKPRDLFDVSCALEKGSITASPALRKCTLFYDCVGGQNLATSGKTFDFVSLTKRDFRRMLQPMLRKGVFFDHEQAREKVTRFLSELFRFEPKEIEFAQLFSRKIYRPELLFEDPAISERIQSHPMALWKSRKD